MQRTVVAEEVQPYIVDCFDTGDIEDGYEGAGKGTLDAAAAAAAGAAVVAVGVVNTQDPAAGAVEIGLVAAAAVAAAAAETELESAAVVAVLVLVLVDLLCCRMERGWTGLDSFYGRKKLSPLKGGCGSRSKEKRGPCGTRVTSQGRTLEIEPLLTTSFFNSNRHANRPLKINYGQLVGCGGGNFVCNSGGGGCVRFLRMQRKSVSFTVDNICL